MKKAFFILLFLSAYLPALFSQSQNDSIFSEKVFLGHKYYTKAGDLTQKQVHEIVSSDWNTEKQLNWAEFDDICSNAFCFVGGFTIGYTIGSAIISGTFQKPYYYVCAFGVGCIVMGGVFSKLSDNHLMNAVGIYNTNIGNTARGDISLNFGLTPGGVGLTLSF
ncbi:MAG: hypothetical protein MJZ94_02525 [Bacteroidales bacterium]|nr:hypothetical protein [Bacteroidales bacterium]